MSRRNALRHGLTAETVIDGLEDTEDYRGFEAAIISDYNAETAIARELVLRLASLLWRLRRIIAIETDLFRIQAEILRDRRNEAWEWRRAVELLLVGHSAIDIGGEYPKAERSSARSASTAPRYIAVVEISKPHSDRCPERQARRRQIRQKE